MQDARHNPPREWIRMMSEDPPRGSWNETDKLRYFGFCAPDGTVRARDKEAFIIADPLAPWRQR